MNSFKSVCRHCGDKMEIVEIPEYPGKTIEVCKRCEKEKTKRMVEIFENAGVKVGQDFKEKP